MTQERQQQRNYFQLNGGLNTESNEINFPEGFTTDEQNYELLRDGSRRRRKGLAKESGGGADFTVSLVSGAERNQTYIWRNVAGDPDQDFYVLRCGDYLYFADAAETVGTTWLTGDNSVVYLPAYYCDNATAAQTTNAPVTFSQGRGRLLVSGQYIYPFYVEYTAGEIISREINIRIRDYTTVRDGTGVDYEPTSLDDDHSYNLLNRGWPIDRIDQFYTDLTKYPGRNSIWYRGYKRVADESTASATEKEGTRTWDSAKLDAEGFGQSSAPVGALFLDPKDTRGAGTSGSTASSVAISTWIASIPSGYTPTWTVTITTSSAHGIVAGEQFSIVGNEFSAYFDIPIRDQTGVIDERVITAKRSLDGTHTAAAGTTGSTIVFTWNRAPSGEWAGWKDQYITLGDVGAPGATSNVTLNRSTGAEHPDSWQAIAWFAGRGWYAGMLNPEFNDYIFFSQVVDGPEKYGKCYQEADPTDENFNALTSTDGGYVTIPGMGGVIGMEPLRDALIVFGRDGVWAIESGQGGFAPTNFRVRKISESGASSIDGVLRVEDSMIYTGSGGIYIIAPNQYTGQLEVQNIIKDTIQTLWTSIPTEQQELVQTMFDDAQRRIYFLYGATASSYSMYNLLILDIDQKAWFKYVFTASGLLTAGAIPSADDPSRSKKIKFIYTTDGISVNVADFDQTTFLDWDDNASPSPKMYTTWETLNDGQRAKQAPVVTVFSKRTETGFTVDGLGGWDADNPSSTLMSGFWDWTSDAANEADTGKITDTQEVYRHRRNFIPAVSTDLDGYAVVVTRNKLRGRGRALQLKFEGGDPAKDSHILGYTVNYKVTRRK